MRALLALLLVVLVGLASATHLLAVNTYPNTTNAVVSVDLSTGDLNYVTGADIKLFQIGVFSAFPSSTTLGKGDVYYVGSMVNGEGITSAGAIFAFAKNGNELMASPTSPYPPVALGEDPALGKLFGYVFDLAKTQLDLVWWPLPLSNSAKPGLLGVIPTGWMGTSSGGCYDPTSQTFYIYTVNAAVSEANIFGLSVIDGSVVSRTPDLDQDTYVSTVSCDMDSRAVALTQDADDPEGKYYLSTIDLTTGITTPIGITTILDDSWTPMSVSINIEGRAWVGTFQNEAGVIALYVLNLDNGGVMKVLNPWTQGENINDLLLLA